MKSLEIEKLLEENSSQLKKLHTIVQQSLEEEKLISKNLLNPIETTISKGDKISDKVAKFGGSWKFIITFGVILSVWIAYNSITKQFTFDPYPFILMNLILSCVAALQAPVIMMSQNRKEEKDRMRNENDYLINLKAELEIRSLHQKMDLLIEEQINTLFETQKEQYDLLKKIESKLHS